MTNGGKDHEPLVLRYLHGMRLRNLSERTVTWHADVLRRTARWHGAPILYLDHATLTEWQTQRATEVIPSTLAGELSVLRSFYGWCIREEFLTRDPTLRLITPKVPRRLPRPMPDDRYAAAMYYADPVMRAILGAAGWAGLRAKEIAGMSWPDIDHDARTIRVVGKGDREGIATFPPEYLDVLAGVPRRGVPVIPRRDGRPTHNAAATISHYANGYLRSIGIRETLHQLRHLFGTNLLLATGNLRIAQEGLRHATPASTAVYTYVCVEDVRSAVDRAARRTQAARAAAEPMLPGLGAAG